MLLMGIAAAELKNHKPVPLPSCCRIPRVTWTRSLLSCNQGFLLFYQTYVSCHSLVKKHGVGCWSKLLPEFEGRIGKQLRERWNHELRPDINKQGWTHEEERLLVKAHKEVGNSWAEIAKVPPPPRPLSDDITPQGGGQQLGRYRPPPLFFLKRPPFPVPDRKAEKGNIARDRDGGERN